MIQAVVRRGPVLRGGTDGNLLRACHDGSQESLQIAVDFTGTNPSDPSTGTVKFR